MVDTAHPGREAISAIGVHGQWVYLDRKRGVAIIKQSSQPISSDPETDAFIIDAFDAVIDHLQPGDTRRLAIGCAAIVAG